MATSSKRTWLIVGSIAVLSGAGFFVWWKFFRKPKDEASGEVIPETTPSSTSPPPVDRPADVTAFQKFAKSKGADLGKSGPNKDGVDGVWGGKTQAAWDKYKTEYNKMIASATASADVQKNLDNNLAKSVNAIDYIVGGGNVAGKSLISTGKGQYYNLNKQLVGKARTGASFGKATSAKKFDINGRLDYQIFFTSGTGVNYYTFASMSRVYIG